VNPQARITTSWDDGHPLDMRLAERLARYGIPATFYIPFRSERPVLDRARIRELAAQFEIGAHTMSHANLRTLSADRARQEIVDSRRYIEDITGVACDVFAPPGGKYGHRHVAMVRDAGFAGMRTVELMHVGEPTRKQGLTMLPTSLQLYSHSPAAYLRNAARRFRPSNWMLYLIHAHCRTLEQAAASILSKAETLGGVFHLWGHSWELEEEGLWPALENTLRLLQARAGRFRLISNGSLCQEAFPHEHFARTVSHF
jgi:peptidoglycan/xylan/chitin deacetylase (PgdA/CDA1 family)